MDRKKSLSSSVIRNLCKQFIRDRYPKELDFFDIIWDIFGKLGRPLREKRAQGKRLKFLRRKTFSALGFTEAESLDLVTPSVIALISAATYHLGTQEGKIEREEIRKLVDNYARVYGVKRELRDEICTHLVPLLKIELSGLKPIRRKPEAKGEYEVTVSSREDPLLLDTRGLKDYYTQNRPEDFFVWIDITKHEYWINQKKIEKITPLPRKTLEILLKGQGECISYGIIYSTVEGFAYEESEPERRIVHRWIADLHQQTGGLLRGHIGSISREGYCWKTEVKYSIIAFREGRS